MKRRLMIGLLAMGLGGPALGFVILDRLYPFPLERLERPAARIVTDHEDRPLRFFLAADGIWRFPATLETLPPEFLNAVIASEDRWFYRHPGVNPFAVVRASWQNWRQGRTVSGGSTIPMQIARMIDPAPRTLSAKAREAFRALQLGRHLSKREVLEAYVNLLPYGGNVEGVEAASYFYFGKEPRQLSTGEIGLLVILPRSPTFYDPSRHPARVQKARDRVLTQLGAQGVFSPRQVEAGRRQALPGERLRGPFEAPHLARWAAETAPFEPRIQTTIDRGLQRTAEAQVARRIEGLRRQSVGNASVVVIENDSLALRAMVGSAAFFDAEHDGQVNGTLARRSPGSTLKPFLYALALDRGEVLVDSYLLDVPTDYAGYVAENYDGLYRGRVTVEQALRQSLNAPAVRLLARTGLGRFHDLLVRSGLKSLDRPSGSYGLPLILGAGEVSLLELTTAYAGLARGGRPGAVHWLADAPLPAATERLYSREATWLITQILTEVERPDLPGAWDLTANSPTVAWKTGTSYGHRDAWAVGFSRRFTIGVWVGNFDGAARQGISGSEHAAPLLFDLFRALEPGGGGPAKPGGLGIETLELCSLSHQLPGRFCPSRIAGRHIRGRSRLSTCEYHRRQRVTNPLHGRSPYQVAVEYPPELVTWWRQVGSPIPQSKTTTLGAVSTTGPPRIVSPDVATPYRLRRGVPLEHQKIPLIAQAGQGASRLYWYLDGSLVATGAPGDALFLEPQRGSHRVVVTDDRGRSDSLTYRVE